MDPNNFFMVAFSFGCLMGLVLIYFILRRVFGPQAGEIGGWELRGAWGRIAAVARTTIAEGLRTRIATGFVLLILIALPVFWFTAAGDGTVKGRAQMFIAYAMGFTGFLLALLTVIFSCRSLSVEIAQRQIYAVITKPVPRWQILLGKWSGVMAVNVCLLGVTAAVAYGGALAIVGRFKTRLTEDLQRYAGMNESHAARLTAELDRLTGPGRPGIQSPIMEAFANVMGMTREQVADLMIRLPEETRVNLRKFDELRRQVLVARATVSPKLPDIAAEVEEAFAKYKEAGQLPEEMSPRRIRELIAAAKAAERGTVPPGMERQWDMQGPAPEAGRKFLMSIRFKIHTAPVTVAVTLGGKPLDAETILAGWRVGDPRTTNFVSTIDTYPTATFHEIEFPEKCVQPDGTITIGFANLDPREVDAIFDFPNGLQVLYRVGSFPLNVLQTFLAMLIPLGCLASFGVCASTFLTFPVGTLIVLTLYLISCTTGFIADSLAVTADYGPEEPTFSYQMRKLTVEAMAGALHIGDLDPVRDLIEGRAIQWGRLWDKFWKHGLIKNFVVLFAGVMIFRRRELAAVIV